MANIMQKWRDEINEDERLKLISWMNTDGEQVKGWQERCIEQWRLACQGIKIGNTHLAQYGTMRYYAMLVYHMDREQLEYVPDAIHEARKRLTLEAIEHLIDNPITCPVFGEQAREYTEQWLDILSKRCD